MMQNIRLFNVSEKLEKLRASQRHKKVNVLHHPVQDKTLYLQFILTVYIINQILHPAFKVIYFICNWVLGQPASVGCKLLYSNDILLILITRASFCGKKQFTHCDLWLILLYLKLS